jgi:hypothetical protein
LLTAPSRLLVALGRACLGQDIGWQTGPARQILQRHPGREGCCRGLLYGLLDQCGGMAEVAQQLLRCVGGLAVLGAAQLGQLFFGVVDQAADQRPLLGRHRRAPRGARAGRAAFLRQDAQLSGHGGGLVFLPQPPRSLP